MANRLNVSEFLRKVKDNQVGQLLLSDREIRYKLKEGTAASPEASPEAKAQRGEPVYSTVPITENTRELVD